MFAANGKTKGIGSVAGEEGSSLDGAVQCPGDGIDVAGTEDGAGERACEAVFGNF